MALSRIILRIDLIPFFLSSVTATEKKQNLKNRNKASIPVSYNRICFNSFERTEMDDPSSRQFQPDKKTVLNDSLRATLEKLDNENRMDGIVNLITSLDGAHGDFESALWAAYALNNLDTYESYLQAEKWLKGVEKEGVHSGIWHYRYSVALTWQGKFEEALAAIERGTQVDPSWPWGWLQLARMQYHAGKKEEARQAVSVGLKLVPGDYEFLTLKNAIENNASKESILGHFITPADDTATARSHRIARLSREKYQYERQRARQLLIGRLNRYHLEKNFPRIVEDILAIPPTERGYELTVRLARAYNNLGEYARAVESLESVKAKSGNDAGWHFHMGAALYRLGRAIQAKIEFERVLELDPEDGDAWQYLAWCCHATGDTSPLLAEGTAIPRPPQVSGNWEHPKLYTEKELAVVKDYIANHFGGYDFVFHELSSPDIHIDIAIINPTVRRPFYTLVTIGMGAHKMNVPSSSRKPDRAEMLICLPPTWDINSDEEKWYWPLRWLKVMARLPISRQTWLGWGHTVPHDKPFAENTELSAIMLINPGLFYMEHEPSDCILPDGDAIHFYQMVPILPDELEYLQSHGANRLVALLDEDAIIINPHRLPVCPPTDRETRTISHNDTRNPLTEWKGPQGCLATDRIMIDGCKVGYMYREKPDDGMPDSGWRFTAGDESAEYMADPDKTGIYSLNVVSNVDPDIIPLLDAPYGTAWLRDKTGRFRQIPPESDENNPLQ